MTWRVAPDRFPDAAPFDTLKASRVCRGAQDPLPPRPDGRPSTVDCSTLDKPGSYRHARLATAR